MRIFFVIAGLLAGCAAREVQSTTGPSAPPIELERGAAAAGSHGRLTIPYRLARSVEDLGNPRAHGTIAAGRFVILETQPNTLLACEYPALVARVKMLDGERVGETRWVLVPAR